MVPRSVTIIFDCCSLALLNGMFHAFRTHDCPFFKLTTFRYWQQLPQDLFVEQETAGICNTSTYCAAIAASSLCEYQLQ
jgi:hypothetical protein